MLNEGLNREDRKKMIMQKLKRCLVAVLATTTIVSSVPVYATDVTKDNSIEVTENQTLETKLTNSGQKERDKEETENQDQIEQRLNYLYIENPYVETPETQRIVVSWGEGTEGIEEIYLSVEHDGETQLWSSQKAEDGTFLYEYAFEDGQDGIYTITKITVKTSDGEAEYTTNQVFFNQINMQNMKLNPNEESLEVKAKIIETELSKDDISVNRRGNLCDITVVGMDMNVEYAYLKINDITYDLKRVGGTNAYNVTIDYNNYDKNCMEVITYQSGIIRKSVVRDER